VSASYRTTFKLLQPYARKHWLSFVGLALIGWLASVSISLVFLMLKPTAQVLFPGVATESEITSESAPAPVSGVFAEVTAPFKQLNEGLRAWLVHDATDAAGRMACIYRLSMVIVGLALFASAMQYIFIVLGRRLALEIVVELRLAIARHLMGLSVGYHGRRHFGDLLSRVSNDVGITLNILTVTLKDLVQEPLAAITALSIAAFIAPLATLFTLLGILVIVVPVGMLARKVRKRSTRSLTTLGSSMQALAQMFQGIRTVKAFRAEEREIENYPKSTRATCTRRCAWCARWRSRARRWCSSRTSASVAS
jgi:ABC-type multidrug transport system fused ATPase/permease subunit